MEKENYQLIPWVKEENFNFISGDVLLAIRKGIFFLPQIVVVLDSQTEVQQVAEPYRKLPTCHFDYYAIITNP